MSRLSSESTGSRGREAVMADIGRDDRRATSRRRELSSGEEMVLEYGRQAVAPVQVWGSGLG